MAGIWIPWLADAARAAVAGTPYQVFELAGWQTRGHGPFRALEVVVGHHTGTADSAPGDYPTLRIVRDGRSDLAGPLCNYGLGRSGSIYIVAAGVAWHAGASAYQGMVDLNDEALGIEAESAGGGRWTPDQLVVYPRLVRSILDYIRRPMTRYASHRTVATPAGRKDDPRGIEDVWMQQQAGAVRLGTPAGPPSPATKKGLDVTPANHRVSGAGSIRLGCPTGSASMLVARAWVSALADGPGPGKVHFFFQDDRGGRSDVAATIPFADGHSGRAWAEFPDGATQVNVVYDFGVGAGGTIVLEVLPK
jgi:hypothetical protein